MADLEPSKPLLNLSNITFYTTYGLVIGLTYSIARAYFYYTILLHIPIFQYIEASDLILNFHNIIFLTLYVGSVYLPNYIGKSPVFTLLEKIFFGVVLYGFMIFLIIVCKNNDPIVPQFWRLPLKYFCYGIIPFLIYMYVLGKAANREGSFFKTNLFIAILLFALWYGVFESFANYQVLTEKVARTQLIIKLKNGNVIKTDSLLAYAGRTKTNWFFYSVKTKMVRTIKNDDVDIVDFDTILK